MGRRVRLAGVCAKPDRRVAVFYKSEGGYFRHGAMKSRRASLIIVAYFCLSMITVSVLHRLSVCANIFFRGMHEFKWWWFLESVMLRFLIIYFLILHCSALDFFVKIFL